MSKSLFFFSARAFLFVLVINLLRVSPAHSQTPTLYLPVALAPLQRDSPIELVALTLDADIREVNGRTIISGTSTFKLHNTDRLNDLQIPMGFPTWAGDPYAFDPARLENFSVTLDNKKIKLESARAELKIGKEIRAVDWFTFTLPIAGDEKRTVRFDFEQDLGDAPLPRFSYGLATAGGWKGAIGSARLTIRFPETTTLDQIIAYDPPDPNFDGAAITWLFQAYEPPTNPFLQFIRPALWSDYTARRRAVQQNPGDANARTALGGLLRQLALLDSPRRDSFFAQAVAENETALRLDPNQRAARQSLAQLYEARAGAASGPRNAGYVLLAVEQWQVLNDAAARRQLAEDYFYLGLDAQTRGAYADAQKYFDQAAALAPGGVGPLYTPERLAAQRRALYIFWARDLIARNDSAGVMEKSRPVVGDAFLAQFKPPAFLIARGEVEMRASSRQMRLAIVPYAASSEQMQNMLSGVVARLRADGIEASYAADAREILLTIIVPFSDTADLNNKLKGLANELEGVEWSRARAVIAPSALTFGEMEEVWARTTRYRETVDLSGACRVFSAQLENLAPNVAALQNANDAEAQLKRALLAYAQTGWQSALAQGRVTYRVGSNETVVDACAAREVAVDIAPLRVERVAAIVIVIEILGGGILLLRRIRRKSGGAGEQGSRVE
ncbi:MAG: hypothetical protein HY327_02080 [Chloroflexi bacterium]|nr:hypothetical protein [Chloroflexota bacterium]